MDDQRANREGGSGMTVPHFSLQRLLVSMTLVAVGAGVETWLFGGPDTAFKFQIFHYAATLGLAAIGAGLFAPFKRERLGAAVFGCTWLVPVVIIKLLEITGTIAS
jgi:hypothetical protein